MDFRIADTFTASLAKLTGDEQKAAKQTAFDLQMNPASPGMRFHKLDKARDNRFWSVRVGSDIRLIVHRTDGGLLLCFVDHHDDAYRWAERRKIERHPRTGAAQLVEVRETVQEITVPRYVEHEVETPTAPARALFDGVEDSDLLAYGVPEEWLDDVRAATEDTLFDLAERLPSEAAEALLELATGGTPEIAAVAPAEADPFEHPDAQRRFRVIATSHELQLALDFPWERWTVFLHPAQRDLVERPQSGPARVAGSAGTGKTVVALHRGAHLARENPRARVLLTTFSTMLARSLRVKLDRLVGDEQDVRNRIAVRAIDEVGIEIDEAEHGRPSILTRAMLRTLLKESAAGVEGHRFSLRFLEDEWSNVVDAWQLDSWESYRDVARLGRKTRLGEKQRSMLWQIFSAVRSHLHERGLCTMPMVFARSTRLVQDRGEAPYDFAVVDEAQDISVPQLRFLAALGGDRPDALFFAGDLGQRIFQTPFSWKSLGVDIRGRSTTLRINYRTSHQIRAQADRLLPPEIADVDGVSDSRRSTVSAFSGPEPTIERAASEADEISLVAAWLNKRSEEGVRPHEMGVFVRSSAEMPRAVNAIHAAGLSHAELDGSERQPDNAVAVGTMHLAKGLEYRAVVVMACDDEVLPLQQRIECVGDEADLEEVYNTERHLLYVACTRARERLLVSGVDPASEFLDDLRASQSGNMPSGQTPPRHHPLRTTCREP
jgi:superfamily I DNA/RNA helicase/mRNA-degrading endonuclease RelE of RelBE toxin-antitoxin system